MSNRFTKQIIEFYKQGKLPEKTLIKMSCLKEELEKLAVDPKALSLALSSPKLIGTTIAAAATLAGLETVGDIVWNKYQTKKFEKMLGVRFNDMFKAHPNLKKENLNTIRRYFLTLARFSPSIASDPQAAGAYIRSALDFADLGGPGPDMLKQLTEIEKNRAQAAERAPATAPQRIKGWLKDVPLTSLTSAIYGGFDFPEYPTREDKEVIEPTIQAIPIKDFPSWRGEVD